MCYLPVLIMRWCSSVKNGFIVLTEEENVKMLRDHELIGHDTVARPKILLMRIPVKSIFMGVVGQPIPNRVFDGRILLERVVNRKYIQICTSYSDFSNDTLVYGKIKDGK